MNLPETKFMISRYFDDLVIEIEFTFNVSYVFLVNRIFIYLYFYVFSYLYVSNPIKNPLRKSVILSFCKYFITLAIECL